MRLLVRSPILRTTLIFLIAVGVASMILPQGMIGQVLDSFIVAGAVAYYIRFYKSVWIAIRMPNPDAAAIYMSGVSMMVLSSGIVRTAHWIGLIQRGITPVPSANNGSVLLSCLLVMAIYMLVLGPPLKDGKVQMSPYAALAILFLLSLVIVAGLFAMRWFGAN